MADQWASFRPAPAAPADPWSTFRAAPAETPNPDGTYGSPPDGIVLNPATGQMEDLRSPANPTIPIGLPRDVERVVTTLDPQGMAIHSTVTTSEMAPEDQLLSLLMGAGQGLGFNMLDETVGALSGMTGGDRAYDTARMREAERRARENAPGVYGTGMIGGALSGAAAGANALGAAGVTGAIENGLGRLGPKLADGTIRGRAVRGAIAGSADGALAGAGAAEGGLGARAEGAETGATLGATVGAGAPAGIAVLSGLRRGAANLMSHASTASDPERVATGMAAAMRRAGKTTTDVQGDIAAATADGQPMFAVADALGLPGRRALNGAARLPGSTLVEDTLVARQQGQGDRIAQYLAETMGAPDTAAQRIERLTTARGDAADIAYRAASSAAGPVDVRGALGVVDQRLAQMAGSGITGDATDAMYQKFRARLAARNPAATQVGGPSATSVELSDFDRVLGVKRDVEDALGRAVRAGEGNLARQLGALKDELDAALEAASPAYRQANDDYRAASDVIRAVDAGSGAAGRARPEDVADQYRALNPAERDAYRAGYADPVQAKIAASPAGANKAQPFTSAKRRADLDLMGDDPALFQRRLDRESEMFRTYNKALGGSQTADNMADMSSIAGEIGPRMGEAAVAPGLAMRRLLADFGSAVANRAKGMNEATREDFARALLSGDPAPALAPYIARVAAERAENRVYDPLLRVSGTRSLIDAFVGDQ